MRLIIDAHLDLAYNALHFNRDQTEELALINQREAGLTDGKARGTACVNLPEMRRGKIAVCLATVLSRAKREVQPKPGAFRLDIDFGTQHMAYASAQGHLAYYRTLQRQGELQPIQTAADLREHWDRWQKDESPDLPIGYILAMEGADPIVEPEDVDLWWEDGLRSLILAHYGKGHYSEGTGCEGGLTEKGKRLLPELDRLGMILDLTHTTDRSFDEAMDQFSGPVMASHSNCRALAHNQRQLNDEQIATLIDRGAVIGVAFDAWMITENWVRGESTPEGLKIAAIVDHIDHYCQLAGNANHVAIGSDLDGGFGAEQRPSDLHSIADLQQLDEILSSRGYSDGDIDKILHGNWMNFFLKHLPAK